MVSLFLEMIFRDRWRFTFLQINFRVNTKKWSQVTVQYDGEEGTGKVKVKLFKIRSTQVVFCQKNYTSIVEGLVVAG